MSKWGAWNLTEKGLDLQAKVEAGKCKLEITKVKFGSGVPADLDKCTDLAKSEQEFAPSSLIAKSKGKCIINTNLTNKDLVAGYYLREWGLMAKDTDGTEILYAITTDSAPDYVPGSDETVTMLVVTLTATVAIRNTSDITIVVDPTGTVTVAEVNALIEEHDKKYDAHYNVLHILQRDTAYIVNDVANHKDLPSWLQLKCITAGTTASSSEPSLSGVSEGDVITDGTVKWLVAQSGGGGNSTFWERDADGYFVLKSDLKFDASFQKEAGTGYITLKV